jgi:hypothetical protein
MERQMKCKHDDKMHHLPPESNLYDEYGNTLKPAVVQDCNRHMGYADKSHHTTNSYTMSRHMWKWTKNLLFHPLGLFNSKQFYSPHFLWFKIISAKF